MSVLLVHISGLVLVYGFSSHSFRWFRSIPGAVLGGLVIGVIEALVPSEYSGYKDAVAFGILFIMLLVRPQGLLGKKFIQKV